jgi:hypothetical protein
MHNKAVEEYQPDVAGLSAMTFQFNTAQQIAEFLARRSRNQSKKLQVARFKFTSNLQLATHQHL